LSIGLLPCGRVLWGENYRALPEVEVGLTW
jgi:hypothetical protein